MSSIPGCRHLRLADRGELDYPVSICPCTGIECSPMLVLRPWTQFLTILETLIFLSQLSNATSRISSLVTSTTGTFEVFYKSMLYNHYNGFTALFWDHPGEPVPEENFWTLWCKGRLTEADTLTIQMGATPSGLTSAHLHHPPYFSQAGCPSCRPSNSVKALKATSAFRLGRRRC